MEEKGVKWRQREEKGKEGEKKNPFLDLRGGKPPPMFLGFFVGGRHVVLRLSHRLDSHRYYHRKVR